MNPRREKSVVIGMLALGALVALVAAGQPRVSAAGAGERITGADTPAAAALSLVVLAGAGALLLVRGRGRSVLGAVILAAAVGIVAVNLTMPDTYQYTVFTPADSVAVNRSVWAWLGVLGGVLSGLAAVAATLHGGGWPGPRRRYTPAPGAPGRSVDAWETLDRGEDPTR